MGIKSTLLIFILVVVSACLSDSNAVDSISQKAEKPLTQLEAKSVYILNCASCHGEDGQLGASGAANLLVSNMTEAQIRHTILKGNNKGMMPYEEILTTREIDGLVGIVKSLQQTK